MRFHQPSPQLVAALATLTAVIATGVAGFLLEQNLELRQLASQPPALVKVALRPAAPAVDTSNWKTYRNEKYGFEIKYPQNLYVNQDEDLENDSHVLHEITWTSTTPPVSYMLIEIMKDVVTDGGSSSIENEQNAVVGGISGKKRYGNRPDGTAYIEVNVKRGLHWYELSLEGGSTDRFSSLFEQILSTFKFTK